MNLKTLLATAVFLLLFTYCTQQRKGDFRSATTGLSSSTAFVQSKKDSINQEVISPLTGHRIPQDSLATPLSTPLQGNLQRKAAFPNIQALSPPEVVTIPDDLPSMTPGKDGFLQPETREATFEKVEALFQSPSPALSMTKKEGITYDIRSMNTDQGLLSNDLYNVLEDHNGHLWFATSNGLSRYNGYQFTHFTKQEGLPGNRIVYLFEDSQNRIWMGFAENGVGFFDGHSFTQFSNVPELKSGAVWSIREDARGNIWIGTYSFGLFMYDGEKLSHFSKERGFPWKGVITLDTDPHGGVWLGELGALYYDGAAFNWITKEQGLINDDFGFLYIDPSGKAWLGTMGGVSLIDDKQITRYTNDIGIQGEGLWSIVQDHKGVTWVGSQHAGITGIDGNQLIQLTTDNGLNQNGTVFLTEDSGHNLWMCTIGSGAAQFKKEGFVHFDEKNGLSYPSIRSIQEDRSGNLWFGTDAKSVNAEGLIKFDGQNFIHIRPQNGLYASSIRNIEEDQNGELWLATSDLWEVTGDPNSGGGVIHFDGKNFHRFSSNSGLISNAVMTVTVDKNNNKWFGTRNGVTKYDGTTFTHYTTDHGLLKNHVTASLVDSQGRIWFGYLNGGASCIDGTQISNYSEKEELPPYTINAIVEDSRGFIWMATDGGGLNIFDGKNFYQITQMDGLLNNFTTSILEDKDQNIWIGTHQGMNVMVPDTAETVGFQHPLLGNYRIITLGKEDGLRSTNLSPNSIWLDRQNRLWIGATQGLNVLDLNKFQLPDSPPKHLSLSQIDIDQQYIDYRRLKDTAYREKLAYGKSFSSSLDSVASFFNYPINLNLPNNLNHLTFYFSAVDWRAPHQIKYSFLMEGFDQHWSLPSSQPQAEYRNLPPGTYTFKVRAIGIAQLWSEPFEYPFTIRPPWWQTTWAYAIYVFLIGLFGYLLYRYLLNRQLELQEAKRIKELDEVKTKLYTNISHEFRTPLTVISGMGQKILENPKKWGIEGGQLITRNAGYLLQLVNQILDLRKLESGSLKVQPIQSDIVSFLQYLMQSFQSLAENKDIRLHFYAEEKELVMDFDPDKIQHIFTNLLSNAIKYTPEGGDVYVRVEKVEGRSAKIEGGEWNMNSRRADLPLKGAGGRGRANLNSETPIVILKIRDTGIGIPEDQIPHIFDRFYQVDDTSTTSGERLRLRASAFGDGTGIGLALTKELVQLLKGEISVKSEGNKGTEFTVQLPRSNEAPLHEAVGDQVEVMVAGTADSNASLLEKSTAVPGSDSLALIVEDNPDVARYIFSCLEDRYQLLWAKNGQQGIDMAYETVPDIVISDVMMPVKDGFEVCETLKQDVRTSHIPIILLTAKADVDSKLEGLRHGADAYLAKPFNPKELDIRLEQLIELRKKLQDRYQGHAVVKKQSGNLEDEFLTQLNLVILDNISDENFGIQQLCRAIGMSRTQLHRKIKALTDKSTSIYIRSVKLSKARELLKTTKLNISEIAYEVGFSNPVYFTQVFSEEFGLPPSEMRG